MAASDRRRVLVTTPHFDEASADVLRCAGIDVVIPDESRNRGDAHFAFDQLVALLEGAEGWILGQARVGRELLQARPELLVLSRRGVGYERIDVSAAADLKKIVTIAAGGNDDSVADHTLALILGLSRRIRESQALMVDGTWRTLIGSDLHRKTVGIIGFGRIGRSVAKRLSGFDATVLVSSGASQADAIRAAGAHPTDLPTLLAESDVVTLHAPLTDATRFMIDRAAIGLMKPSALLVNTARGGLVHDADLLAALREGRLAGAGLDVFLSEADPTSRAVTDELIRLPHVLATPHAAASSREGLARTNRIAADNVIAVLAGGSPPSPCVVVDGR